MTDEDAAAAAATRLFALPGEAVAYEPSGERECAVAVRVLASCFADAGGTMVQIVASARDAAQVLSDDRLQGLSEIVQNADDAGATRVRFEQRDDELVAVHNGAPIGLADVHALAAPWLSTKRGVSVSTGRFGIGLMTLHALAPALRSTTATTTSVSATPRSRR